MTMLNKGDRVLAVIQQLILHHGYSPTVREIVDEADLSSTSVAWYWMRKLRDDGLITWVTGRTRTIRHIAFQDPDALLIVLRGDQAKLVREACGDHDAVKVATATLLVMAQQHRLNFPTNGHAAAQGPPRPGGPRA